MKFITYEDRRSCVVAIKLLVLSIARWCPGASITIVFPDAPEHLLSFLRRFDFVTLSDPELMGRRGWNVKPYLLLQALDAGDEPVIWLDADLLLTKDPHLIFADANPEVIFVAQEYFGAYQDGGTQRTLDWGLTAGRRMSSSVNSCIVRVTSRHRALLKAWDKLLMTDDYREGQAIPWELRPTHVFSDQDVLNALLGSERFGEIPIRWVRRGAEIAQCIDASGFTVAERIRCVITGRRPSFIHSQGDKPWSPASPPEWLYHQVSPYTIEAEYYSELVDEPMEWVVPRTASARFLRRVFRNDPIMTGILPAALHDLRTQRSLRAVAKKILRRN